MKIATLLFVILFISANASADALIKSDSIQAKPSNLTVGISHNDSFYVEKGRQQYHAGPGVDNHVIENLIANDNEADGINNYDPEDESYAEIKEYTKNNIMWSATKFVLKKHGELTLDLTEGEDNKLLNSIQTNLQMKVRNRGKEALLIFSTHY